MLSAVSQQIQTIQFRIGAALLHDEDINAKFGELVDLSST